MKHSFVDSMRIFMEILEKNSYLSILYRISRFYLVMKILFQSAECHLRFFLKRLTREVSKQML